MEGIIDGERAFYGDPIAELVSLAVFAEPAGVPGPLPGYLGRDHLTDAERDRLRLYQMYLEQLASIFALCSSIIPFRLIDGGEGLPDR
ncbi:hypothetical protein [Micromonospora sp. NPDC049891]|uniref:hypothetical protein n=1 Tax=Micromonospora sp. NPDC049891 TaxID=3155655 RepID=UPI0033EE67D2